MLPLQPDAVKNFTFALSFAVFTFSLRFVLRRKLSDRFLRATVEALTGLVIFLIFLWLSSGITDKFLKLILEDTGLLISAFFLYKAVFLAEKAGAFWSRLTFVLILLAFASSTFYHLLGAKSFYLLEKLFICLSFLPPIIVFRSFLRGKIREIYVTSASIIFFSLSAMWILGTVSFSILSFIGAAVLVLCTIVFAWLYSHGSEILSDFASNYLVMKRDVKEFRKYLRVLSVCLYAFSLKYIFTSFFSAEKLFNLLKNTLLIKTDLVYISLYNVLSALCGFIFMVSLIGTVKKLVKFYFPKERQGVEGSSAEALVFNLGVLVAVTLSLSMLGITWKVLLPVAGTLGIGIGFGLQAIMNNYISGFILLFSRKLRIGDVVELPLKVPTLGSPSNVFGRVEEIGILSTIVRTNDGVEIAIPNSSFINSPIVNFSHKDSFVRVKIPVGVAYDSNPLKVKRIIEGVLRSIPNVMRVPRPEVWFYELGDSALIFVVAFWIDIRKTLKIERLRSEFYYKVFKAFKEEGIEIPFNQNDIWFKNALKVELMDSEQVRKSEL